MPKIRVFLSIQQKQKFHELELLYNPLLYKFEDPICPLCNVSKNHFDAYEYNK